MTEILSQYSNALAEIVEAAGQTVVRVEGRRRLPASGIVWADGIVVTSHHALERDEDLRVGLPDGHAVTATLVGRDPTTDVAVLRAETPEFITTSLLAGLASLDSLRVGHLVLALGRPGQAVQATLGIVKALGDAWHAPAGGRLDRYLETDIAMYPGFSGGPLVDVEGRLLGLNTSALLRGATITVPPATLRQRVEQLLAHGRIRQGYLGVGVQPARLPAALEQRLGQDAGLLVSSVEPGSPAERGGLVLGDTLLTVEGQPVRHLDDLMAFLGIERIGHPLSLRVLRGGQAQEIRIIVGERS